MPVPFTETDLCNVALDLVGEAPIANISVAQRVPELCERHYVLTRREVLQENKWHIALALDDLAEVVTPTPPAPWTKSFQQPTDWLATFDSNLGGYTSAQLVPYQTLGQRIYTDAENVRILYARDIPNVSEMPPLLQRAISARLATYLVIALKGDDRRFQSLAALEDRIIEMAKMSNAIVDPVEVWGVDYLTTARKGYNSPNYIYQDV